MTTRIPPYIPKNNFRNLLNITTKGSFFTFNRKYYEQVDGVATGSPFFMCSFESKWLRDCPNNFKPVFYRRYVDDIFALFSSPDHADKFKGYLSSKHPNISFSIEKEKDDCLLFLDVNIFCKTRNLQQRSIEQRPPDGFIPTSKVLYLKHKKLV